MDRKIRLGIIGCGRISYKHIEAASNFFNDIELVSVCDVISDKAEQKVKEYVDYLSKQKKDVSTLPSIYMDYEKMLDNEQLDLVSICTPSGLHPIHGISVAKRGINVLTEKPMATNLKLADDLIRTCDENKVKLFVVKQNRLNTTMQYLKKAIDKNRFGRIYMMLVNVLWTRPQSYYDESTWRGTWEFDGGAFMNQASHYFDLIEWFGGPVEYVTAATATMARRIETEDTGSAIIKFRNGIMGNVNVTMLTYPKNLEGSITVIGEKGTVRIGGVAINKVEKWEFAEPDEDDIKVLDSNYEPPNIYGFGHTGYYENVIDVLKNGSKPSTDGRGGRKSLELILALYKSSREGRTIHIPLDL
ncbi:MAG: Gfo/Idh/MocA family oxidoreductase [Bacillota bacterium]|nr:Gfo/Idh/MocA family oxidoreductase [Bacillota bacterium]